MKTRCIWAIYLIFLLTTIVKKININTILRIVNNEMSQPSAFHHLKDTRLCFNRKTVFPDMEISLLKIRRPWDLFIFIMEISVLVGRHFYVETAPRFQSFGFMLHIYNIWTKKQYQSLKIFHWTRTVYLSIGFSQALTGKEKMISFAQKMTLGWNTIIKVYNYPFENAIWHDGHIYMLIMQRKLCLVNRSSPTC